MTAAIELAKCVADSTKNSSGSFYSTKTGKTLPPSSQTKLCLSREVAGDFCYHTDLLLYAHTRIVWWLGLLLDQQKWTDNHPEQPEGYLVFPSGKVSAEPSHILPDCTVSRSKDLHGAVKLARKALRHLRACQAGIPDDGAEFPSQPYIAGVWCMVYGVISTAKTATGEACTC